jgi:hypothetical protein
MCARWIFACFDPRRPRSRDAQADRSKQERRFELFKDETPFQDFEAKPELEETDAFGELALAGLVLPRVKASIVERAQPLLPIGAGRDGQARLCRIGRARQAQHPREKTSEMTAAVCYLQAATGANR